jgi:cytoskeletal protein CcmA (bactofilin family)
MVLAAFIFISAASAVHAKVIAKESSVVKVNENINMGQGMTLNDLVAIRGNVNVKGNVNGDIVAVLGDIHLFPTAKVAGNVVAMGGRVIKDKGAVISGRMNVIALGGGNVKMTKEAGAMDNMYGSFLWMCFSGMIFFKAVVTIGFIGLAMLTIAFFTGRVGKISSYAEKNWFNALLWGILGLILILPVALLLVITLIGIPLILVEMLLISMATTLGYIAVAQLIGKNITKALKKPNQPMLVEAVWGIFILFLIDIIPIVGPIVKMLALTIGFGAAITTKLGA